jgi:ABC-type transport system substrate-binding protein
MSPRSIPWSWKLLATVLLAWMLPLVAHAEPAERVYAGVYLHDVTKFDQKDGVFDVDMEVWAKWLGDFDPESLQIANAAEVERTLVGEESDGRWHAARWRVKGTLRGEFPVHRFPFDRQTLRIVLELPERAGELLPDLAGSGMRERFSVTGWLYDPQFVPRVAQETYASDLGSIAGEGQSTLVNRAAFEVTLHRPLFTATTKLFVPLLVILLVALIALMVHPKWLDVRSGVGVTALLACFAFQFSVADTMPSVAYMTLADILFLIAYALTAILLFESVAAAWLHERGLETAWKKLDLWSLALVPVAIAAVVKITVTEPEHEPPPPAEAMGGERPASERDVLRIGTNALPTASGGLAGRGTNWGTVRTELDGTRLPALVEEVPAITNDALTFLAGGELEVRWHLREGLRWSDAMPLTAADLEFALQVSPDPRIVEMRTEGTRDLVVRFADRVAMALEDIRPMPRHALMGEYAAGGYDAVREYRRANALPSAGPYRVVEFTLEERLVLEANPFFAGPAPSIGRIEIQKYEGDAELVAAFDAGEIDMIFPNAISPEAAVNLAGKHPDAVWIRPSELQMFIHGDPSHPLFSRFEVRHALLMAIDRERIWGEVFGSEARLSHVPVPGEVPEGTVIVPYDPQAARAALEAAGALDGKPIPFVHGSTSVDEAVAKRIVEDAAAVGLNLVPKAVKRPQDTYRNRNHGGLVLSQFTGERDALPEKYWALPQKDGKFDRTFRSDAFDDDILALVEREERALYPERREQIRDRLFVEYSKRLPCLPIVFLADRIVAVPELEGWTEGSGVNFGTTVERWYFETPAAE